MLDVSVKTLFDHVCPDYNKAQCKKQTENVMSISRQKSKNQAKSFKPKESETSLNITFFLRAIRVAQHLRQETSPIIIILITKGGNPAHSGPPT